jgi:dimethylargininase
MKFTRAIVRLPGPNFADGLTTSDLGTPEFDIAQEQHSRYCDALRACGLAIGVLPADPLYPDGAFVEDTAIVTPRGAISTCPSAPSRRGEVERIRDALGCDFARLATISGVATIDGGDVLAVDGCYFIGVGRRTNDDGARQAAAWLESLGYSSRTLDISCVPGLLHLKSGASYLGDGRLVLVRALAEGPAFRGFEQIVVANGEELAANCVRVNDRVLVPSGCPALQHTLGELGCATIEVGISEFQKMDGGLSCLSLRY